MRPKKNILLWCEDELHQSLLTFAIETAIRVKVHRAVTIGQMNAILRAHSFDLLILCQARPHVLDAGFKLAPITPVLSVLNHCAGPVLLDQIRIMLIARRGPKSEGLFKTFAEVA